MLTGRESLRRVIGRRRRFLPNRSSILSSAFHEACSSSSVGAERGSSAEIGLNRGDEEVAESVKCPVCMIQLPARDNAFVNSHLDKCLARGSKRKLGQLTLLQLDFSRSKLKTCSNQPKNGSNGTEISEPIDNLSECERSEENGDYESYIPRKNPLESQLDDFLTNEGVKDNFSISPLISVTERSKFGLNQDSDDCEISEVSLSTFIVGHKYANRENLYPGSKLCLCRDPGNIKDSNAIKVFRADCEYDDILGYIPREVAQHLALLIDKFHLNFEGNIVSLPQNSRAAIPIQIVCKNVELSDNNSNENMEELRAILKHSLHSLEVTVSNSHRMTRYQQNMVLLIQEVLKSNSHLLTVSEKSFLEAFDSLPDDCQRLFARLYTRKGPWFRVSNISYPEIADCDQAVKGLLEAGYMCSLQLSEADPNDLQEVLDLLHKNELGEALLVLNKKYNRGARKKDIIDLVMSVSKDAICAKLQDFILERIGRCIKVSSLAQSLMWRVERLFFLNGEQDLSAFLLVDLGIVKFPTYSCIISDQIFPDRNKLLSYEEAIEVAQIMDEAIDDSNSELVLRCIDISVSRLSSSEEAKPLLSDPMGAFYLQFSASWVYSKAVLLGVSFLEHDKRYAEAINLLRQLLDTFQSDRRRGYWASRLSIDLEHLNLIEESLQVAEHALNDPCIRAGSRIALQRRVLRLGKPPRRWKIPSFSKSINRKIFEVHVQGRPLNCRTGTKSIFYGEDAQQCGVEQLALQYYAGEEGGGWQGVHTESGIWLTIFGILMWDVIFSEVQNVFRNKFQTAPLDLETDSFYEARKCLVESHLSKIERGAHLTEEMLIESWESHFGTSCRGVSWEKHSLPDLLAVVRCVGGSSLASVFGLLARDYRSWSSGMPDLLLWRFSDGDDIGRCRGEAKLVEVKGPRDRLSEQQRAWLVVLMECGFEVEVCKVKPTPPPLC